MAAQAALMTVGDYLDGELKTTVRHEFVAGSVYAMAGGSRNHTEITGNLSFLLRRDLTPPCRNYDQDLKVSATRAFAVYYPDATIACPPNFIDDRSGVIDNPTAVFEVLSPSTASMDRGPKFAGYRSLDSLREYVLIDSESTAVEVYSLQDGDWVVRFFTGLDAVAAIPSVGIELRLSELYSHVRFE